MREERKYNSGESPLMRIKHFNEFHTPLPADVRRAQAGRCMSCGVPFCQSGSNIGGKLSGCPLCSLVPEWNSLLAKGHYRAALQRLLKTNCFPEFTARVCPALCEWGCTGGVTSKPVSVRDNELEIIEYAFEHGLVPTAPPETRSGKKVAIVGSGPSGLAAAERLNRRGHSVTVFEKNDRPGGLLMYGIPNMKLEKSVVAQRTELMAAQGVEFVTGCEIGSETAGKIVEEYDAVVLACGSGVPRDICVEGRELSGICFAVDYLTAATRHAVFGEELPATLDARGKPVVVIGGGDTGNDCVGTAIRQGAASVVQLEMMPQLPLERDRNNPWPLFPRLCKTDYGQEEAATLFGHDPREYETTVTAFFGTEKGVESAECVKLEQAVTPEGKTTFRKIPGSKKRVPAQLVLIAAGFLGTESAAATVFGAETNTRGNVSTVPGTHAAAREKVFACGDMRNGQSLVAIAIRDGMQAAEEVDKFLLGY